eukprot:1649604-Rhodomonas_salina.3
MEVHIVKQVDEIWPDCLAELADFVPDGVIVTNKQDAGKHPSCVIVFQFARSYTIEEDELLSVGAWKWNQYQSLIQFLLPSYPRHEVCCLSFILSTLGVLPQDKWIQNC